MGQPGLGDSLGDLTMKYLVLACALPLALANVACGGSASDTKKTTEAKGDVPQHDGASRFDINGDGVPDVWKYFREVEGKSVLVRKEFDVNFDGKVDIWRHYDEAAAWCATSSTWTFDGKTDVTGFYENDQLIRKEVDLEFDQKPDMFKYYEEGKLVRVEGDSNNDGRIDYWEFYKNGQLSRTGTDEDGDGQPDPDKWQETGT